MSAVDPIFEIREDFLDYGRYGLRRLLEIDEKNADAPGTPVMIAVFGAFMWATAEDCVGESRVDEELVDKILALLDGREKLTILASLFSIMPFIFAKAGAS